MPVRIDPKKIAFAHRLFCDWMRERSGGVPFNKFSGHKFFIDDETAYKWRVYDEATKILQLDRWARWKPGAGRILAAAKAACSPTISANLLEHRFGPKGDSASPLYRVETDGEIAGLESALQTFMVGGLAHGAGFGGRFDDFADYLRGNSLGCKWPFVAYLCFLLQPALYFPILPGAFQRAIDWYGADFQLAGRVEWQRYANLLELAEVLKPKLARHGWPNAIQIQSYIWVVSYLIKEVDLPEGDGEDKPDVEGEFEARVATAREKERIGLIGEEYVFLREQEKLKSAGREDLVSQMKWVALKDGLAGYDLLSFDMDGSELHIEVKTTTRSPDSDFGFWLSENERRVAERDAQWRLYRVSSIDVSPSCADLGNIVQADHPGWTLRPGSWFAERSRPADAS
ncbi:MAG: DUF3883 domain-containing protein [Lentisphaeria bacterium]|nr:DUF3883 domain-containing protein [Lentisphaeria bacterium]